MQKVYDVRGLVSEQNKHTQWCADHDIEDDDDVVENMESKFRAWEGNLSIR